MSSLQQKVQSFSHTIQCKNCLVKHHTKSFIWLSETWLDDNKEEFYDLKVYSSVNTYRINKKCSGVSLHIQNGIPFISRNDLDYFDSEMETIFI